MDRRLFVVDRDDDRKREVFGDREEAELAAVGLAESLEKPIAAAESSGNVGRASGKELLFETR